MAKKFLTHLDLNKNELQNAVMQQLATAPGSPVQGQMYYDTVDDTVYVWDGAAWLDMGVQGGSGATNLAATLSATNTIITSDTGTDATIPAADTTNAGVMTKAMFDKLAGIEAAADVTDAANVDAAGATMNADTTLAGNGYFIDEDSMASDLATKVPSQQSVKAYADTKSTASKTETLTNKTIDANGTGNAISNLEVADFASGVVDTDSTMAADSDTRIPTQKAVKAHVAAAVTGLLEFKGSTDASTNPNYPAASKGDSYVVSVAGKVGGASGKTVEVGDMYVATADNAGGTEASVGTSWTVLEHNLIGALLSSNNLSDVANAATAFSNIKQAASLTATGVVELATDAETNTGTDTARAITPSNLEAWTGSSQVTTVGTLSGGNATGVVDAASTTAAGKSELATAAEAEARTDTVRAVTPVSLANFPVKKTFTVGDNSATSIALTHSLGTKEVITQVRLASDDSVVECDIVNTSTTVTTLTFAVAPATNAIKAVVMG